MKKIWITLLTIVIAMAAGIPAGAKTLDGCQSPVSAYKEEPDRAPSEIIRSGDYDYLVNEDNKTVTIVEYSGDEDEIEIPAELDGHPVTEIAGEAFSNQEMKSLSLPDGILQIGSSAFEYCVVTDMLKLPENIEIGKDAFGYAELPSEVEIPAGATIDECAFNYCEVTERVLVSPKAVIKSRAFGYSEDLTQVICAEGCRLEKNAFEYCYSLKDVILCGAAEVAEGAFSGCPKAKAAKAEKSEYENWTKHAGGSIPGMLSGGWDVTKDASVTKEAQEVFDQAMPDSGRVKHEAVALLATQVVAGENYCFLVRSRNTGGDEKTSYKLAYIWKDAGGKAQVMEVKDIEFGFSDATAPSPAEDGEKALKIIGSPASKDGVTVTLEKATASPPDNLGFTYAFSGTIENNSDEGIMQVIYTFALIDEDGEEYRSFGHVYDGEDEALPPGGLVEFSLDDVRWGLQSIPASVEIGISTVKTESELPPVHVPETGEYLYRALGDEKLSNIKKEPPVELSFHVDQGGYGRTAVFKKGKELDKALELFCKIKIGEESREWVTDNYNWISLKWADGSETGISLNLRNLEYSAHSNTHTFELKNLDEFWTYCAKSLKED